MPPRSQQPPASFPTDANNEVVCPLSNQDGTSCRKRCLGEKRYRSMQEHIRRAHPEHYIAKLPATEESFQLMINTPPSEKPAPPPPLPPPPPAAPQSSNHLAPPGLLPYYHNNGAGVYDSIAHTRERNPYYAADDSSAPDTPRAPNEYYAGSLLPAASAAAALAQLHNHKIEPAEWESEIEWLSDTEGRMRPSIELPPLSRPREPTSEPFPAFQVNGTLTGRPRDAFAGLLNGSPPGRSSTLPPLQRHGLARPRKDSVSKRARAPQHQRQKSKEAAHLRRMSYERKAYSAEPSSHLAAAYGKRWEDLIEAATSVASNDLNERTPMPESPRLAQSPHNRNSMPPFSASHFQGYQASPLQRALTPPTYADLNIPEPFPSVESNESGDNFHIDTHGLSDSSPSFSAHPPVQIYCASCQAVTNLKDAFACTECVCGICATCVDVLTEGGIAAAGVGRRKCPRCAIVGGRFKPFQLDLR